MTAWEFLPWGLCAVLFIGYVCQWVHIRKLYHLIEQHCSHEHGMRLPVNRG
jgi:hypothetical protein